MVELEDRTHGFEKVVGHPMQPSWQLLLRGSNIYSHWHGTCIFLLSYQVNKMLNTTSSFPYDSWTYHVGWQVLRSVMTVTKTTLFCRPCHLSTHRGMCCMRGWTLIMMSGLYFFSPASTFLHPQTRSHSEKKKSISTSTFGEPSDHGITKMKQLYTRKEEQFWKHIC